MQWLREPWPWYVAGPLLGLSVPILLLMGNKPLGATGTLRGLCAAVAPAKIDFLNYDWRRTSGWNIAMVVGVILGAMFAAQVLGAPTPDISPATRDALAALGIATAGGFTPASIFSWAALVTLRGFVCVVLGGFLVGFGSSYAGGCTSGHGVMGLGALQSASAIALVAIFVGGLFATYAILPLISRP